VSNLQGVIQSNDEPFLQREARAQRGA
jgi:hypothetical protein